MKLTINSGEVLDDIRSAAWLEQELHPELDRHRRHQMADICEAGNIELVWRVLGISVSEIRLALLKMLCPRQDLSPLNTLDTPDSWEFAFRFPLPEPTLSYIKEKIHEYLVAAVMAERTAVIIPAAASVWKLRVDAVIAALRAVAAVTRPPFHPVRRPLYPL